MVQPMTTRGMTALVAVTASVLLSLAADARAANGIRCGIPISGEKDVRLKQDLNCPGDGIVVGSFDGRIFLEGHTINGSGTGVGIKADGGVRVSGGGATLTNFGTGIRFTNGRNTVSSVRVEFPTGNGIEVPAGRNSGVASSITVSNAGANGIAIDGDDASKSPIPSVSLSSVNVFSSALDGMNINEGSNTTVTNSVSKQNGGDGIDIEPQPNGGRISIKDSRADYNIGWGIDGLRGVKSAGNTAKGNGELRQCNIVECN
jgi:hypothetical protein